jgi:hypothetical protein
MTFDTFCVSVINSFKLCLMNYRFEYETIIGAE